MALAPGVVCDAEMLETLRLVLAKISPRELDVYAGSSPLFARGGFRPGKTAIIRERIVALLASSEPVDEPLRRLLRDQVRRSLEAGGGDVARQRELEAARTELARLRGVDARLAKEKEVRAKLERDVAKAREGELLAQSERGTFRQRAERAEAELRRHEAEAERHLDALLQARVAQEMAAFIGASRVSDSGGDGASPAARIGAAVASAAENELARWKGAVDLLDSARALSPADVAALRAAVRRRYTDIHLRGLEERLPKDVNPSSPVAVFLDAMAGRIPAILLVDAHNVLFALQSRYRLPNEHRWPTAQTRQWLVDDMVGLLSQTPNVRAYVVFDGPTRSDSTASHNVLVVYSGGEGEHRADGVLVDQARFLAEAGARNLLIVTNDGELAGNASRHGAKCLAPTHLLAAL